MSWLVISVALSIVLTVVLDVGLRVFPSATRRTTSAVTKPRWIAPGATRTSGKRVRVWAPWKVMIVGSLILTIVVNLALRIAGG